MDIHLSLAFGGSIALDVSFADATIRRRRIPRVETFGFRGLSAMKDESRNTSHPSLQVLSGWKDIATYLGKGVRTVQRYEREMGLPVRRPAGRPRASVVATKVELDSWVSASPIREAFQLSRPNGGSEFQASTAAIRSGLGEMLKLRHQMAELRSDLGQLVQTLGQNVLGMKDEMERQSVHNESRFSVLEGHSRREQSMILYETLLHRRIG